METSACDAMHPVEPKGGPTDKDDSDTSSVPSSVISSLREKGLDVSPSGVVSWEAASPNHPRHWSLTRKMYDTLVICFLEFFMTLVSNAGTSIAQNQPEDLGMSTETAILAFSTMYLLGQAIGSLIFPPIGETYGSRAIFSACAFGSTAVNLLIAVAPYTAVIFVCRFLDGLLSAMPAVVAITSLEDMWDIKSRILVCTRRPSTTQIRLLMLYQIFHFWVTVSVIGLSIGPTYATYVGLSPLGWYVILATGIRAFTERSI